MEQMQTTTQRGLGVPGVRLGKDGRYLIDCIKVRNGKRIHIFSSGYLTLEDAIADLPHVIEEKTSISNIGLTFGEFLKRFTDYRLLHVRHSSVQFGSSVARVYLKEWSRLDVKVALTYENMSKVYSTLLSKNCSPEWKNRAFGVIRQMAETAFKWKLVDANVYQDALAILENIPENRKAKKEKLIWTKKEIEKFLSVIEDKHDKILFELFLALGARIGEFMGLTWDCVDLKKGCIEIKQQLIYADVGKWVLSDELKTRESYRVCRLPNKIINMLKEYKEEGNGEGFLFHSALSKDYPLSKASFRHKFYRYIELSGVKRVTPHSIRHRKATDLMAVCKNMEEVKAAARYLGHSATMMIDTYGHSGKSATDAILRRLEKDIDD